jgi:hypothetical protein
MREWRSSPLYKFVFEINAGDNVVRIFLPLALVSTVTLIAAMMLGLMIEDPKVATAAVQQGVQYHFLTALVALMSTTLVHAIVLTYFMGTGRWIEETSNAYRLPATFRSRSQTVKYRTVPAMVGAFLLLLCTGAPDKLHLAAAIISVIANIGVNYLEFLALERNGEIVDEVLDEVRRIRVEKGLAV